MGFERTCEYLLKLPHVEETLQWEVLVYWAGDKAIGGKMFATLDPEHEQTHVMAFAVPPESYHSLLEIDGVRPAPYLARAHWIAVESWAVFPEHELHEHLRLAYERVTSKLPRKTQRVFELSDREYRAAVREARTATKDPSK